MALGATQATAYVLSGQEVVGRVDRMGITLSVLRRLFPWYYSSSLYLCSEGSSHGIIAPALLL